MVSLESGKGFRCLKRTCCSGPCAAGSSNAELEVRRAPAKRARDGRRTDTHLRGSAASGADRDKCHGDDQSAWGHPALEVELRDGSGAVTLVWLGRRQIPGIDPGRSLKVSGRISCHEGRRLIYNPRYELLAAPAHS